MLSNIFCFGTFTRVLIRFTRDPLNAKMEPLINSKSISPNEISLLSQLTLLSNSRLMKGTLTGSDKAQAAENQQLASIFGRAIFFFLPALSRES